MLHAVWTDLRTNARYRTYYARSIDGATFSANVDISADQPGNNFTQPHLALDSANSILYVGSSKDYSQVVLARGIVNVPSSSVAVSSVTPWEISSIRGGGPQSVTVYLMRNNYVGNVTIALGALPSGVTTTIASPNGGSSGTITLTANSGATLVSSQSISFTVSGQGIAAVNSYFSLPVTPNGTECRELLKERYARTMDTDLFFVNNMGRFKAPVLSAPKQEQEGSFHCGTLAPQMSGWTAFIQFAMRNSYTMMTLRPSTRPP